MSEALTVSRWGEDNPAPILLDGKPACGSWSDHHAAGCIALRVQMGRTSRAVHLTTEEALRLSDLLRAMADTNRADR